MKQKTNKMLIFTSLQHISLISSMESVLLSWGSTNRSLQLPGVRSPGRWHTGCKYGSICNCSTWTGTSDFSSFLRPSV